MKFLVLKFLCIGISFQFMGCAVVKPWEREHLSDPILMLDADPARKGATESHHPYREGTSGATGSQGGGCGCS